MQISAIGLDLAKTVFQVHGIDVNEKVVVRKQLRRGQMIAFFAALPPCLVGVEACATAQARELRKLGDPTMRRHKESGACDPELKPSKIVTNRRPRFLNCDNELQGAA